MSQEGRRTLWLHPDTIADPAERRRLLLEPARFNPAAWAGLEIRTSTFVPKGERFLLPDGIILPG